MISCRQNFVVLLLLLLLPLVAHADALDQVFRAAVKKVTKPFYTWHYTTTDAVGLAPDAPIDVNAPEISDHVHDWSVHYLEPAQNGIDVGGYSQGFYLAVDPTASRIFGDAAAPDHWLLYRVELPKGFRYLDVNSLPSAISAKVKAALEKEGCRIPESVQNVTPDYTSMVKINFGEACRKSMLDTLKKMQIDAIKYEFHADDYPGCPAHDQGAFILLNPDRIKSANVQIYYKSVPDSVKNSDEAVYTEQFFTKWKVDKLWPELDSKPTPGRSQWMKKHLLNCQGGPFAEAASPCLPKKSATPLTPEQSTQIKDVQRAVQQAN